MASERRIAANRRNAQQSTGPKTPEGKARVSQNARKHGLRSSERFTPQTPEEKAAFHTILNALLHDIRPRNLEEQEIILEIAEAVWDIIHLRAWELQMFDTQGAIYPALTHKTLPWRLFYRYLTKAENRLQKAIQALEVRRYLRRPPKPRRRSAICQTKPMQWAPELPYKKYCDNLLEAMIQVYWHHPIPPEATLRQKMAFFTRQYPWNSLSGFWTPPPNVIRRDEKKRDLANMAFQILGKEPSYPHPEREALNQQYLQQWQHSPFNGFFGPILRETEDSGLFQKLKDSLYEHFRPHSLLSYILMDAIAASLWKIHRLDNMILLYYLQEEQVIEDLRVQNFPKYQEMELSFHPRFAPDAYPFLTDKGRGLFPRMIRLMQGQSRNYYRSYRSAKSLTFVWW